MVSVQYIKGIPFPSGKGFTRENIEAAIEYKPEDGDIIVTSYPKTGSTWLQYIVWSILQKGKPLPNINDVASTIMPFMEMSGIEAVKNLTQHPRTYKNHLPYNLNNINPNAKYISIHRNPADTVVSFYYFLQQIYEENFEFNDFFRYFVDGILTYGDYFDHVLSFYEHRNDPNLLILSYEEMLQDPRSGLLKVAEFLGYYESLVNDEELVQKILNMTSFKSMKEALELSHASEKVEGQRNRIGFFRKGVAGDGKTILSQEQKTILLDKTVQKMKGTELENFWSSYM